MKDYLVGFSIAFIVALAVYFFYIVPEREKIKESIKEAYQKGYDDCYEDIDTVFVPGETKIIYRDTTVYVEKPTKIKEDDSTLITASSIDTTFISGKDEINVQATVGVKINKLDLETSFEWFMKLAHKDFVQMPDTITVKVPKYITVVESETNWLYVFIAFLTGNLVMILASLL